MTSSPRSTFAARGLAVLQSVGGWVAIRPEQTWVATSIRGIGACKSTFCPAERRELPGARRAGVSVVPLLAALAAAAGILTACASDRPFGRDVTSRGQIERAPADCQADCQNRAASVSKAVLATAPVRDTTADGKASLGGAAAQSRPRRPSEEADAGAGAPRAASAEAARVAAR